MRQLIAPPSPVAVEPGPPPTFSVVIPAYQASAFIGDAVRSALAQTVSAHEVIVCDDGSTDDLTAALADYLDRVILIRRPHRGAGAARNSAIEAASGDFIAMLDADDTYERSRLEALGELAVMRPDLDILATDLKLERAGAEEGRFYDNVDFPVTDQRLAILESCFIACPALRRRRVLDVGGFDDSLDVAGDWDLFIRMIIGGARAGLVPEPLMHYRRHLSTATSDRGRSLWARVSVLEKARRDPALRPHDHIFLERCLVRARTRAVLNDASVRARSNSRDARRLLLQLAFSDETPAATRLMAAAAAVAPRSAATALVREERRVARSRPRRPEARLRGQ